MSDTHHHHDNAFVKWFLPGLVIGLIVGMAIGALAPTLWDRPPTIQAPPPGTVRPNVPSDRDERPNIQPAPTNTPATNPAASPAPDAGKHDDKKPEEKKPEPATTPKP